ncbi:RNA ligase [Streptomyces sp. H39-S7]|uniref:RNA ligase n=1 Tax=Streptomyces sp. H39-S7 TaxID=3004357 RepID=UPI0022AF5FB3|nr:RNA ligase [Streptomyces sp. H39-S7]MCZ4124271.1 RNA ligase [Streptomyces sp. H39-S7]
MTDLDTLVKPADLVAAIESGHVSRRQHPELPISIYTYTRVAQYERAWTDVTIRCRGLVADDVTGAIVAWPFEKFFNVGEHGLGLPYAPALPVEPFEVYDKVDGSLGIAFHYDARWHVASKGSFTSEQATWATRRLRAADTGALDPGCTYLVEILYPENRIVVNYGERRDLVLLAAYAQDGTERVLAEAAREWQQIGSVVRSWPAPELARLLAMTADNIRLDGEAVTGTDAEGYVLRFASGVRTKAKTADYVRLHRVITGVTERDIWRSLGIQRFADRDPKRVTQALGCQAEELAAYAAAGIGPLDALLEQVPDEFDTWVRGIADGLVAQAEALAAQAQEEFAALEPFAHDRAAFARAAQRISDRRVRGTMFQLLDGLNVDLQFWRAIKPGPSDPFANDEEG